LRWAAKKTSFSMLLVPKIVFGPQKVPSSPNLAGYVPDQKEEHSRRLSATS